MHFSELASSSSRAALALALVSAGCSGSSHGGTPVLPADQNEATSGALSNSGTPAASSGSGESTSGAVSPSIPSSDGDAGAFRLDEAPIARDPPAGISPAALSAAVAANNAFAVDLYAHVADGDAGPGNIVTSPFTASIALTMTYAGAGGQTATEMATALHIDTDAGSIFDGQNALTAAVASRGASAISVSDPSGTDAGTDGGAALSNPNYQVEIVNSIWGEQSYAWSMPFLDLMARSYGTGIYLVDFIGASEAARQTINAWVSTQTSDTIQNLLPPMSIDAYTRMVLVDASHIKMPWATPFDPLVTTPALFTRPDGTMVNPSFMSLTAELPYTDDGQAQIVALPLAGWTLSVVIALPHEGVSLSAYEASLTPASPALAQPLAPSFVHLSLPKIAITAPTFSLRDNLQAMGMNLAFALGADFSGLCATCANGLYVKDVLQKATISMQESGLESAAATAVILDADSGISAADAQPPPVVPVAVTRPYLWAIVDVPTHAILTMGHVVDPTQTGM
jgi:serpin B